ncbi:MAG: hypothetical protein SVG88_04695 [Halobacteriales archaeon]|nr:hypothetical protein [Halobacteriales archaeon]
MLRRFRETAPAALVPAAWSLVTAVHLDVVALRPLLIAHLVMDVVLFVFAVTGWKDMDAGVLRVWRRILVLGLVFTLGGTVGLAQTPMTEPLLGLAIGAWMVLPAVGLFYTGRSVHPAHSPMVYHIGAALSLLGGISYFAGPVIADGLTVRVAGLALVGIGQTAGIVLAVYQN